MPEELANEFDENGFNVSGLLLPALRQYQHNDSSGFVAGYDYIETQKIVLELLKALRRSLEIAESALEISTEHSLLLSNHIDVTNDKLNKGD